MSCPECSAIAPSDANFCPRCGASMNPAAQQFQSGNKNGSAMSIFRRLGPREYVEQLASGLEAITSERRIVTTLFADVVASTALAEMLDPEDVTTIMNYAFEAMSEPVEQYEGTLMRLMGDGILCLFGAPVAHEDDAVRACHASLEILKRIKAIAQCQAKEYSLKSFNVRIGISTGLAVVGEVGTKTRAEYTAMGSSVNLSARLQHEAEAGTMLICDRTWRLVREVFDCRDMGLVRVKGKSQPVHVFRVLGAKPKTIDADLESPLVGRDTELCRLRHLVKRLKGRQGGVVCITGEAGIGKSRLLREVKSDLPPDAMWVDTNCHSYTRCMSYFSARSILASLSGIDQTKSGSQARRMLWNNLDQLVSLRNQFIGTDNSSGPDHARVGSYAILGYLLQIPLEPHEQEFITAHQADDLQRNIVSSYSNYIELTARLRPLVLVWDDVHWIDPQSQRILDELSHLSEELPVLLVIVSRPEPGPTQIIKERMTREVKDCFTHIRLAPLDKERSALLLRHLLDLESEPEAMIMPLLSAAEGNPFFLEEISRTLIDTGQLVRGDDGVTALLKMELPQSVQAAILSRIDRLSRVDKTVLHAASVIGRSFDRAILSEVLKPDLSTDDIERALRVLERRQFIRRSAGLIGASEEGKPSEQTAGGIHDAKAPDDRSDDEYAAPIHSEGEFVFKQSIMSEVVYNSLLKAERKRLHKKAGEAMEKLYASRISDIAPTLAYHFEMARVAEKSVEYLRITGAQALQVFALDQAQESFRRALQAAAYVEDGVIAAEELGELSQGLGDVLYFRSDYDEALECYTKALELESRPCRRSALYRKMGRLKEKSGQYELARKYLESSIDELKEDFDLKEAGRSYAVLCMVYYRLGDLDMAVELGNLAQLMNERNQDRLGSAQAHYNLGIVMAKRGDLVSAEIHYESARKIWEEVGDRYGLASCYNNLGLLAIDQEDWPTALRYLQESKKLFEVLNNRHGLARVYDSMSQVYYSQGDVKVAQEHLEKGLAFMAEVGTGRNGLLPEMWQSGVW